MNLRVCHNHCYHLEVLGSVQVLNGFVFRLSQFLSQNTLQMSLDLKDHAPRLNRVAIAIGDDGTDRTDD